MLNQRTSPRRRMVLPVKVTLDQVNHLAHTVDITHTGARLGGLRTQLQPGMIVTLQRGSKKAKFQIEWIRQLGMNEQFSIPVFRATPMPTNVLVIISSVRIADSTADPRTMIVPNLASSNYG